MYRYAPAQRPNPTKRHEEALFESLARGELDSLVDRRAPLPVGLSTLAEKEATVNSLKKILLGMYDVVWGFDGSMSQRGRW